MMSSQSHRRLLLSAMLSVILAIAAALVPRPVLAQQSTTVTIQNYMFQPSSMAVPVGATVTWTNMDSVAHTSTSDTAIWDSGPIQPGASFQHTFTTAGTFTYHCMIHPNMHGTIVVGGGGQPVGSSSGQLSVSVVPNSVSVGMTATVHGAGFTPRNWAFVFWQRPDRTSHGVWTFTDAGGMFNLRLGFAPRHGTGTEFVTAFDFFTRMWAPFAAVAVGPGATVFVGHLSASPNPVMNGRATIIAGNGFAPQTVVVVQWRRPDATMAAVRVMTNGAGSFAFQLVADPRHGCGARTFVGFDVATRTQSAPFVLGEIC